MSREALHNIAMAFAVLFASGCAVMSKDLRKETEQDLTFEQVFLNPDVHKGKVVIWGGTIVDSRNTRDGTFLEVLQKPLDMIGEPRDVDRSGGRFIAIYDGFLDSAIYAKGREVTVGGVVQGKRVLPLGEIEYSYPVIGVREIHLWPEESRQYVPHYYYPGYPWWWHDPFWRPWYYHRK